MKVQFCGLGAIDGLLLTGSLDHLLLLAIGGEQQPQGPAAL